MRMMLRCKIVYSPDKLDLEAVPIFCATVGGATEARGDAVDVTAVCHRVDDPVAAGLDADARHVGELDGDAGHLLRVCNGSHLTDAEAGPQDPDDRLTESRHLHLRGLGCCHTDMAGAQEEVAHRPQAQSLGHHRGRDSLPVASSA